MTTPPHPLYRPGEVDDAAYGPAEPLAPVLPLPRWEPETHEEREAFTAWCLTMLDRIRQEVDLEPALREIMENEDAIAMLRQVADEPAFEAARKLMPLLTLKDFERFRYGLQGRTSRKKKKSGRVANRKVATAIVENRRLTTLWKEYFKMSRRDKSPSRLDILSSRHCLTEKERDSLENYLFKLD